MSIKAKKIIIRIWWILILAPIALLLLALLLVGVFTKIPSFEELEDPRTNLSTQLISEDGVIFNTFHIENRTYVKYDDLPPALVEAAVATEDARFYRHSGIDFRSLGRVLVKTFMMRRSASGGGSTITQQLAKTLYPREDTRSSFFVARFVKLLVNKLREWITAVKLERNYTKAEIITMYMNNVFFGSNAYGIRTAANTFFNKEPRDLTTEECALLVGMVNKPTKYNPVMNPENSLHRREHVLRQMRKYGYISKASFDSLNTIPLNLDYEQQDNNAGIGSYFRDMLRRTMASKKPKRSDYQFEEDYSADSLRWVNDPLYGWIGKNPKPDGSLYNLDKDGLRIYTTINSKMQQFAEEAVDEYLGKTLQRAFFNDMKWKANKPFARGVPKPLCDNLIRQAQRWSDRYRADRKSGMSDSEIQKDFTKPAKMRVFSWSDKGYIDTTMTPNDSIRYYKSFLRAAFVAMEPQTGHVLAYVGGPDYRYFKYDNASQGKRQVGSTIKPFLYTLAMQEGYTPCDKVVNVPYTFEVGDSTWTPRSTDKEIWIGKTVTLKWGLTHSSNNISAYLMKQFGPEAMVEMCRKLGISSHIDVVPSLCVGSCDLKLYEMVAAFNTFPSRGVHINPLIVTRIEDKQGNVLANFSANKRESISERTAYLMVNLMEGVVNEGTAARLRSVYDIQGEVAGKTGTTNDQADGWFIGYTPKVTAGIWVGAEDRQVHFESLALGSGSNMALPIWGLFMQKCQKDGTRGISKDDAFIAPPGFNISLDCSGSDSDISGHGKDNTASEESFFD
ncbi:MAG: transglycosylase domain-containing protein [Bacteroidales bacterium]|jgi:penicillin-binding protein 1A|nr:transglycosylase domain-containing protein [Bacteroidales bacterium]MCI2121859.1 transglycosylase domain-containing protein [Bacteroidales bacterium]MCI2145118.1 transglycosylase domain-containing protein [Bacteroidales bacterium]